MIKKIFSVFYEFIKGVLTVRSIIFSMAKNDFKSRFTGSMLGIVWAFIQPLITIAILYVVFQLGFKTTPANGEVPFFIWLCTGIIAWFFFQDGWTQSTSCLIDYSYLVNNMVFKLSILPLVKIVSAFFVHLFFLVVIAILASAYGFYPSIYYLQLLYYIPALFILLLSVSWFSSAIMPFFKDTVNIVGILVQIGFWATPIVWSFVDIVPEKYQVFFKLNPMFYIVQGYRDTFISQMWFWERWLNGIFFWGVTGVMLIVSSYVYTKLRPHFSDVL